VLVKRSLYQSGWCAIISTEYRRLIIFTYVSSW